MLVEEWGCILGLRRGAITISIATEIRDYSERETSRRKFCYRILIGKIRDQTNGLHVEVPALKSVQFLMNAKNLLVASFRQAELPI